jgi:glycosyltransferase involved in cell wall biosynthesis
MRIAIIIYSLGSGGAERVTAILSRHWSNAGHEVKVITWASEANDFYSLDANVEKESLYLAAASRHPWSAFVSNIRRVRALRKSLMIFRADVAIGMMSTAGAVLAMASLRRAWVSLGAERIHPPFEPLPRLWHLIRRVSYYLLDAVVVQTDETARWTKAHTLAKFIRVIPNPLIWPLEARNPTLLPNDIRPPERFIILAVGRLMPQKGFDRLIEAFAKLHADHLSWDLVILGAGPDKQSLERQRDRLGLNDRVFLPGRAGNVGDWYERASIFAMTSLFEGFPNALLEAMAYGLPVISTDCDTGPRDLIEHDVNGLLVPLGDQDAFAAALRQLVEDDHLRTRLSNKACEITEKYGVEYISEQWLRLFGEVRARRLAQPSVSVDTLWN